MRFILPTLVVIYLTATASAATVTSCKVAYLDSAWDRYNSEVTIYTERAIDPSKTPLLPSNSATFAHYTSYIDGITCIVLEGLDGLTASDVAVKLGNDNTPSGWTPGPTPTVVTLDGKHYLQFPKGSIRKTWAQFTIAANGTTGLSAAYVFYFGNWPGETGNSSTAADVDGGDIILTNNNQHDSTDPAPIDNRYDFNRDAIVDDEDVQIANDNQSGFYPLLLITIP